MPAYFVAEVEVTNAEGYEPYRALAGASIAQYDGRFVARGGKTELVEGSPEPQRVRSFGPSIFSQLARSSQ